MAERTIEYKLQAQNLTAPAFASVQAGLQRLATQQNSLTQTMQRGATAAAAGFGRMAQAASTAAARIGSALKSMEAGLGRVVSAAGGLIGKLGAIGGAAGGLTLAGSFAAVARAGVSMNVTLEGARIALTNMTGSSGAAAKLIGDLRDSAKTSMGTFKEMLPIAQSLVAVLGVRGLGQVVPIMRAFGDVAAGTHTGTAGMQLALLGFRQLMGPGGLERENIKQITEAMPGFKGFEAIQQRFGTIDTKELQDRGVTGSMVGETLVRAMQTGPFAGMQAKLAKTLPMVTDSIQDTLNDLSGSVTAGFTERLRSALMTVADFLANIQKSPQGAKLLEVITRMFDKLGDVLVQVANNLPQIVGWLADLPEKIIPLWTNMQTVVVSAVKIIGGAIAGLGAFMQVMFPGGGGGVPASAQPGNPKFIGPPSGLSSPPGGAKPTQAGFGFGIDMDWWGRFLTNPHPNAPGGRFLPSVSPGARTAFSPGGGGGGGSTLNDFAGRAGPAGEAFAAASARFAAGVDTFVNTLTKPPTSAAPKGLGPFQDITPLPGPAGTNVLGMFAAAERNRRLQGRAGSAVGRGQSWIEYSEQGDRLHMSQAYRNSAPYSDTYDPMMRSDPYNRWLSSFRAGQPGAGLLPPTGGNQNWSEFSAAGDRTRMSRTVRNRAAYSSTYDPMMKGDPYNQWLTSFQGEGGRSITINIAAGAGPEQILEVVMRELRKVLTRPSG